jgi:hypothetical protein
MKNSTFYFESLYESVLADYFPEKADLFDKVLASITTFNANNPYAELKHKKTFSQLTPDETNRIEHCFNKLIPDLYKKLRELDQFARNNEKSMPRKLQRIIRKTYNAVSIADALRARANRQLDISDEDVTNPNVNPYRIGARRSPEEIQAAKEYELRIRQKKVIEDYSSILFDLGNELTALRNLLID